MLLTMPILGCCRPSAWRQPPPFPTDPISLLPNPLPPIPFNADASKRSLFALTSSPSLPIFSPKIVLGKAASERNGGLWIRASAFAESNSDEGARGLEQDDFVNGPSELIRPNFVLREVESTVNRLSKWIISAIFGGFILWRHDAEALWFAAGSALNVMLSVELKHILNQERPSTLKSDPGMPSSHAQTVFFIAMLAILSSVKWVGMNEFTITISGLALAFGFYFSYLRVSQQLHTVNQVVVGAAIGTLFCCSWYWLWNAFVLNAIGSSLAVKIIVVFGSAGIWMGFTLYSILQWLKKE